MIPGDELLITSVRTGNTEVFAVDPLFGNMRNLTHNPLSENRYPIWSPDGSQIVFTSDRDRRDTYNLYIMDAQGHDVRRLTDVVPGGICYFPSWTGDVIYFGYASSNSDEAVIASVRPDGSDFRKVGDGRDPSISPDGITIAFTKIAGAGYCVFTMRPDGSGVNQLTTHENEIGAVTPVWSPDGTKLLYSDEVEKKLELFTYEFDGGHRSQLTHLRQFAASSAWSPDGSQITFRLTDYDYWRFPDAKESTYREKQADKRPVWIMDADGSNPRILEVLHYQCALDGSRPVWRPRRSAQ